MLGLRRCRRGRLLAVPAVLAIAAIALVPRGLVRAAAASQLSAVSPSAEGLGPAPEPSADLPGVRTLIAREEQDSAHVVIRVVTSSPAGEAAAAATWRLPDHEQSTLVHADPAAERGLVHLALAPERTTAHDRELI